MQRSFFKTLAFSISLVGLATASQAQWTAFNDHVPSTGAGTSNNTTRLKIPSSTVGPPSTNGFLKNIANGTNLPVTLTIGRSATGVRYENSASTPANGTPLQQVFGGFVDFGTATDATVELSNILSGTVTYIFSGLNPSKRYNFKGAHVRGNANTNRLTRVELQGADSFVNGHSSARVFTTTDIGTLTPGQAVADFARNNAANQGDYVGWDSINPGADGSISIVCAQYTGPTPPGVSSSGTVGYAITGIRLEELPTGPPVITTQPTNQTVEVGSTATFAVVASGAPPLTYRWYKNNILINGAINATYTTPPTVITDNGSTFKVSVSNATAVVTSTPNAILTVTSAPPSIVTQPQNVTTSPGATATFTVSALGSPTLRYQWYRNNSMIAAATNNSYTTPTLSFGDSGSTFSVTVINPYGTTNSTAALLTISVPPVVILPITNNWKYNMDGQNLGTAWRDVGYNDSAWSSGRGGLGVESAAVVPFINTTLNLNGTTAAQIWTFYFRTHFTIAGDPFSITLVSSNIIDDAAAYYVNGQEVPGSRYNMTVAEPAPVVYTTPATAAATEGVWVTNVIPSSMLVQGDNVIAVEVHQVNLTSSDIVFVNALTAFTPPPTPLVITSNPGDRSVFESASTTFTVLFTGAQPVFQWYKWVNDVPVAIPGAVRSSYTITNTTLADSGYYFVSISNALSQVASPSALLTVLADVSPPLLLAADGTFTATNVTASFSKGLTPATATNVANYKITNMAGGTLIITNAVLNNGTNVILTTTAPRSSSSSYLLIVNNVQDITPHNNVITPNSTVPISFNLMLVPMEATGWDYYNPLPGFNPLDPGANWNQFGFVEDPDHWGFGGQALFVYDPLNRDFSAARHTDLSSGAISSYFRLLFNGVAGSPVGGKLLLRHIVDDGIIAYLNGVEVYRFNMPAGPVNTNTPASSAVGDATLVTAEIPITSLRSGTNLFAVELHETQAVDPDLVFGAELQAQIFSYSTGAVQVTQGPRNLTVNEGEPFQMSVMGVGAAQIQWRTNGVAIPGATNPVFSVSSTPANWNGKLFSVVLSNPTGSSTSTNALLTVNSDTFAPALVSAYMASPTSLLVGFSEAVSQSSGTTLANYRVTNSVGANFAVQNGVLTNGGTNVLLTVANMPLGSLYTLIVNNVRDNSSAANRITSNSTATVGFQVSIPFNAVWRFNTNDTDLGTAWRNLAFNDSGPEWSSGPGLIAEEAGTPGGLPILTPISRLVNGVYHYTFNFRYKFYSPVATNVPITFRHIIDDGALFYMNGQQFHQFNMTNDGSTVTYTTDAGTANEAGLNGPYTTNVNLVAGTNIIAVEVHQSGTGSSDIVFGADFSPFGVQSVSGGGGVPPLQISKQGTNVVVNWPGVGFTLEKKNVLSPGTFWAPVTNQGPLTVAPKTLPNPASFYRLRK